MPIPNGVVSVLNSTATALGGGQSFTGKWEDVSEYGSLIVAALTDQIGTAYVDFSTNASNVDSTLTFNVGASENEIHRLTVTRKYARVRYTNGSVAQSFLRLQTMYGSQPIISSPLNSASSQDADAIICKILSDELLIAEGLFDGFSIVNKFGRNPDVDTSGLPEDIWGGDGVYTGFASAAETLSVVSSSANDASAGTGLRTLRITGLDANYNVLQETVTLNGLTPVTTTSAFLRAHTVTALTAGSGGVNAGTITVTQSTTTTNVMLIIDAGTNQSYNSAYTIPAGYTGYLRRVTSQIRGNTVSTVNCNLWTRPFGSVFRARRPFTSATSYVWKDEIYGGLVLTEKSDIVIRATACSANNTELTGGYDLILVRNA